MKKILYLNLTILILFKTLVPMVINVESRRINDKKLIDYTSSYCRNFINSFLKKQNLKISIDTLTIKIAHNKQEYTNFTKTPLPDWSEAVSIFPQNLIVIKSPEFAHNNLSEYTRVLRHEIIHMLQNSIAPLNIFPSWFNEGIAKYYSEDLRISDKIIIARAIASKQLIKMSDLEKFLTMNPEQARLAYEESATIIEFLVHIFDDQTVWKIVELSKNLKVFGLAFQNVTGLNLEEFEDLWIKYLDKYYKKLLYFDINRVIWVILPLLTIIIFIIIKFRNKIAKLKSHEDENEISDMYNNYIDPVE